MSLLDPPVSLQTGINLSHDHWSHMDRRKFALWRADLSILTCLKFSGRWIKTPSLSSGYAPTIHLSFGLFPSPNEGDSDNRKRADFLGKIPSISRSKSPNFQKQFCFPRDISGDCCVRIHSITNVNSHKLWLLIVRGKMRLQTMSKIPSWRV